MGPSPPGFDRIVVSCRSCGEAVTLDLQRGIITPEQLHQIWRHCTTCLSGDIEIAEVEADNDCRLWGL